MASNTGSIASDSVLVFLADPTPENQLRLFRDFQRFAVEAAKRHFRRFHRWFVAHGNPFIAEDVGSEAVLRFIELVQRGGLSSVWESATVACLHTFVKSRLIDFGKAEARRVARNFRLDSDDILASASNSHEEFEEQEVLAMLEDIFSAMPERDREVYDHFMVGPSSAAVTGLVLGLSTRQVYERTRSIRKRLRRNSALRETFMDSQHVGAAR
jgi:RNA polymerase sigma factor (sigma-70 family)